MTKRKTNPVAEAYCAPECANLEFCTESGILQTSYSSASIEDAMVDDTWNF